MILNESTGLHKPTKVHHWCLEGNEPMNLMYKYKSQIMILGPSQLPIL